MTEIWSAQFGQYVCDVDEMRLEIQRAQHNVQALTMVTPCAVALHDEDLSTFALAHVGEVDLQKPIYLFGMLVHYSPVRGRARLSTCRECRYGNTASCLNKQGRTE